LRLHGFGQTLTKQPGAFCAGRSMNSFTHGDHYHQLRRFGFNCNVESHSGFLHTAAMEIKRRTWTKALTWQALGLLMMTFVNYLYLGSLQQGLGLSVLLAGLGLITYVAHEWLWSRVHWGLRRPIPDEQRAP